MSKICDDDEVSHEACPSTVAHADHFWRVDGKADRYAWLDSPHTRYCLGRTGSEPR